MPKSIARPPWTKLGKSLESSCRKALYDFSMIDSSAPLTLALSGGKDSLSLLFLLHAISGRGFPPFHLHALHVAEHFSPNGEKTRKNLEEICKELGVPLTIKPFPPVKEVYGLARPLAAMISRATPALKKRAQVSMPRALAIAARLRAPSTPRMRSPCFA